MVNIKKNHDLGMLLLRLGVGVIFIAHGWFKFADMDLTITFFAGLGLPSIAAYVVALIELLGGIALVVGMYTDLAALLLAIIMAIAVVYVKMLKLNLGLTGDGGYELDLALLVANLAILFNGPGRHVISHSMFKR